MTVTIRRAAGALVAVLVLVAAPAHAARHHHRHHGKGLHCRFGYVTGRHSHHRRRCLARPRPPHGSPEVAAVRRYGALAHHARLARRRRHRHRPARRLVRGARRNHGDRALVRALRGDLPGASGARAARARARAAEHLEQAGPTVDGWETQLEADVGGAGEAKAGSVQDITVKASKDLGHGLTGKESVAFKRRAQVNACPDADGVVPGTGVDGQRFRIAVEATKLGAVTSTGTLLSRGTTEGHVGDDGVLRDYDLRVKTTIHVQAVARDGRGRVLATNAPFLYTMVMKASGLKPGMRYTDVVKRTATIRGVAPRGHYMKAIGRRGMVVDPESREYFNDAVRSLYRLSDAMGDAYAQAQDGWQHGGCIGLAVAADRTRLHPGETATLTATTTAPPGERLASGRLIASAASGSVTPPATTFSGAPVTLHFAAPASWQGTSVRVTVVSRQGTTTRLLDLAAASNRYALRFTSDVHRVIDRADDAGVAHGDTGSATWAVAATVPLTGDPAARAASGRAPLAWTSFAFSEHHAHSLCQDGTYGSLDRTGTSADPGTLVVDGLTSGPAGVTLAFHDAPPTEHYQDSYDATGTLDCHDWVQNSTSTQWDAFLRNTPGEPGVSLDYVSGRYTITGWQAGTGDVLAYKDVTRTLGDAHVHVRYELVALP